DTLSGRPGGGAGRCRPMDYDQPSASCGLRAIAAANGAKRATWRPTMHNCSTTAASFAPPSSSNLVTWLLIAAANGVGQLRSAWTIERSAAIVEPVACQP